MPTSSNERDIYPVRYIPSDSRYPVGLQGYFIFPVWCNTIEKAQHCNATLPLEELQNSGWSKPLFEVKTAMLSWRGHEIARMRHDLRSWYDEDNGIFWIPPYHFLQPLANQKRIYMLSSHVRHALVMWESEAIRVLMGQYYEGTIIND